MNANAAPAAVSSTARLFLPSFLSAVAAPYSASAAPISRGSPISSANVESVLSLGSRLSSPAPSRNSCAGEIA